MFCFLHSVRGHQGLPRPGFLAELAVETAQQILLLDKSFQEHRRQGPWVLIPEVENLNALGGSGVRTAVTPASLIPAV